MRKIRRRSPLESPRGSMCCSEPGAMIVVSITALPRRRHERPRHHSDPAPLHRLAARAGRAAALPVPRHAGLQRGGVLREGGRGLGGAQRRPRLRLRVAHAVALRAGRRVHVLRPAQARLPRVPRRALHPPRRPLPHRRLHPAHPGPDLVRRPLQQRLHGVVLALPRQRRLPAVEHPGGRRLLRRLRVRPPVVHLRAAARRGDRAPAACEPRTGRRTSARPVPPPRPPSVVAARGAAHLRRGGRA